MQNLESIQNPHNEKNSFECPTGYSKLFERIDSLLKSGKIVNISIDGMCGSGKTYLSAVLEQKYDCNVFHADNFFLQKHQRTDERLAEVGGNLDFERIQVEILDNLKSGEVFEYRRFSCSTLELGEFEKVTPKKLNIVEGSYIQNPKLKFDFDINVFVCTSKETQESRILKRNGEGGLANFRKMWIPKENAYFEKFSIKENCDLIIQT